MTNKYLFLVFFLVFSSAAFGQKPSCKSLHIGDFKIVSKEGGTTLIKRTEEEQWEKNESYGYEVIFSIKWIDDCTYELRPRKLIKGDPSIMGDGTNFVKTRIKDISDNTYVAETSASFFNQTIDFLVDIVK